MKMTITKATQADMATIQEHARAFNLDCENMKTEEFRVAKEGKELMGFGRLHDYGGFVEISTVGVISKEQNKGIGTVMTDALIQQAKKDIYLVTVIPGYFRKFGFEILKDFPEALRNKYDFCRSTVCDKEETFVMKYMPSGTV